MSSADSASCTFVVFGAGGDLTKRKLIPALYNLAKAKQMSENFAVVGISRERISNEEFRARAMLAIEEQIGSSSLDRDLAAGLVHHFHYFPGDASDSGTYAALRQYLAKIDRDRQTGGRVVFYLAVPPGMFGRIAQSLADAELLDEQKAGAGLTGGWRRVVFEKPFGRDLESARDLNATLGRLMREDQIYRIDHYLGKETVQNVLAYRFANGIFEPIWNRSHIDSVQITVAETLGIEHRAGYYESAGALRDMVASHLFQLLSLVAMEPPVSFTADDVRDESTKALEAIKPMTPEAVAQQTVRGQYSGYRSEEKVSPKSNTETYVALKLELDNWRWAGVPFYLRTGKRLANHVTEIAIDFKRAPYQLFRGTCRDVLQSNSMVFQIQPREQISLTFSAKVPGVSFCLGQVQMDFDYADYFGHLPSTGYETLLHDCMNGDSTLFRRADQVEKAWSAVTPILTAWSENTSADLPNYTAGSQGPAEADGLLARDGRKWRVI